MLEPKLENDELILKTTSKGGEMLSLYDKKKQRELLYQADEGWSGRNPSLFPAVGSTWKNGDYLIKDQIFHMKNHGLIRYANLIEKVNDHEIIYTYSSDKETRKQYPFDFEYQIRYTLDKNVLHVDYKIKNTSDEPMPFMFGLHPAFKTGQNDKEKFEDFYIDLSPKGEATQLVFKEDLSPVQRKKVMLDGWKLNREDLQEYATLIYDGIACNKAVLRYKDEDRLAMTFNGFPTLALWSHPTPSNFVCIEPWFGHADLEKVEVPYEKREGMMMLSPGDTFTAGYTVEAL